MLRKRKRKHFQTISLIFFFYLSNHFTCSAALPLSCSVQLSRVYKKYVYMLKKCFLIYTLCEKKRKSFLIFFLSTFFLNAHAANLLVFSQSSHLFHFISSALFIELISQSSWHNERTECIELCFFGCLVKLVSTHIMIHFGAFGIHKF